MRFFSITIQSCIPVGLTALLLAGFVPFAAEAVVDTPAYSCDLTLVIDGEPHEWGPVGALVEDDNEIAGTSWYYNSGWSTAPSAGDTYSMVPAEMLDLAEVKLCNSATKMYIDFETYYPPFKLFRIGEDQFYELGDPAGADTAVGLPEAVDHWFILKLAKTNDAEAEIYYYALHFTGSPGDTDTYDMIAGQALYQESDAGADFAAAQFDPSEDTLLVDLNPFMIEDRFDNEAAYETSFDFLHPDGVTDAASVADFTYGDTLDVQAQTYQSTGAIALRDQTDVFQYEFASVSVGNVRIPRALRRKKKATVRWDEISGAAAYQIRLLTQQDIVRQKIVRGTDKTFRKLQPNTRYRVSLRAQVGDMYTPYTAQKRFKTR